MGRVTGRVVADVTPGAAPVHLPALLAFVCVDRHMNFGRAAAGLEVSPTAISKTIRQLESQLGVRLFNRTTRSVALSEPGAQLLTALAPALEQIRHSVRSVSGSFGRPYGTLRINTSFVAYAALIRDDLQKFLEQYPNINVEVSLDNALTDIVERGFDASIRLGHAVHRDMVAVPLGSLQRPVVVGSPAYFEANPQPQRPQDLLKHNCIRQRLSARFYDWEFCVKQQTTTIDVTGRLVFDEMRAVLDAAKRGGGLAYVFEQFAGPTSSRARWYGCWRRFHPRRCVPPLLSCANDDARQAARVPGVHACRELERAALSGYRRALSQGWATL